LTLGPSRILVDPLWVYINNHLISNRAEFHFLFVFLPDLCALNSPKPWNINSAGIRSWLPRRLPRLQIERRI